MAGCAAELAPAPPPAPRPPTFQPQVVVLGAHGGKTTLVSTQSGGWTRNGDAIESGTAVRGENSAEYLLTLSDGRWTAEFVRPAPIIVALGSSGSSVPLYVLEDGRRELNGELLVSGQAWTASNGYRYRFEQSAGAAWTATFVGALPISVRLGESGGTVEIQVLDAGRFQLHGQPVQVPAPRGRQLDNGNRPSGAGCRPTRHKRQNSACQYHGEGGFLLDAEPLASGQVRTVASGDSISVRGVSYVLTLSGTRGTARRQSGTTPGPGPPVQPGPGGPLTTDSLVTYEGVRPRLRDQDGRGTREGSILEVNGERYSLADLSAYGWVDEESTFVENARERIVDLLEDIQRLLQLSDSGVSFNREIEKRWDDIVDELDVLFPRQGSRVLGANAPKERNGRDIDGEELVEDVSDVIAALSSLSAFEDALDRGIFRRARIDEDDLEDLFTAAQSIDRLGFGWTENTRFGAYSKRNRTRATASLSFPRGEAGIGAFAYSPLGRTRTSDLPVSGAARYRGETIAASGGRDQLIYRGEIELNVQFNTREVTGLVSNLRDRFGDPWRYGPRDVDSVTLPVARLHSSSGSFQSTPAARARLTYASATGTTLSADFEGQFVGTGREAGEAAIGTWQVRSSRETVLTAAFGTEYQSRTETPLPPMPPVTDDSGKISRTSLIARPDSDGNIKIAARDSEGNRIEFSASELFAAGESVTAGDRLVALASGVIARQVEILNLYIDIGEASESLRTSLWKSANQALEDHVFGPSAPYTLRRSYPSGPSRGASDQRAVQTLRDVLDALSSPIRLEDSLGEGGVFEGVLGSEERLDQYEFDDIVDARDYAVEIQFGHTNYGRFGAWAKVERDYAANRNRTRLRSGEAPDVFAYSPLRQTAYSASDPNFASGITATYVGQTRAVDHGWSPDRPQFYGGEIDITVQWADRAPGSSVRAVVRNLASIGDGRPFKHSGSDVSEIVITGMRVSLDSDSRMGFSSVSPTVRIRYDDIGRPDSRYLGLRSHEGKFVGYGIDGPAGVIGTWRLGNIKGAYEADAAP